MRERGEGESVREGGRVIEGKVRERGESERERGRREGGRVREREGENERERI